MMLQISLINGLVLGIEHMQEEEDEDISWMIVVHLALFRFVFLRLR